MTRTGHVARCPHCGSMVEQRPASIEAEALALLAVDLDGAPEDCWRFFRAVWTTPGGFSCIARIHRDLAVSHSTLYCRMARRRLPSPKVHVQWAACTRAARALEAPGATREHAAAATGYTNGCRIGVVVRQVLGLTLSQLRAQHTGASVLAEYRRRVILPHLETLRSFSPLVGPGRLTSRRPRLVRVA